MCRSWLPIRIAFSIICRIQISRIVVDIVPIIIVINIWSHHIDDIENGQKQSQNAKSSNRFRSWKITIEFELTFGHKKNSSWLPLVLPPQSALLFGNHKTGWGGAGVVVVLGILLDFDIDEESKESNSYPWLEE